MTWSGGSVVALVLVLASGCDEPIGRGSSPSATASSATASSAPPAARATVAVDGVHDMMARKEADPYTIAPSSELVLEIGDHVFATRDGGRSSPDAVHVAHGSAGYYRASFTGKRVVLSAGSLDPVKGGAFPGFEAGESYIVAMGTEASGSDGAMRFAPAWIATVKVALR